MDFCVMKNHLQAAKTLLWLQWMIDCATLLRCRAKHQLMKWWKWDNRRLLNRKLTQTVANLTSLPTVCAAQRRHSRTCLGRHACEMSCSLADRRHLTHDNMTSWWFIQAADLTKHTNSDDDRSGCCYSQWHEDSGPSGCHHVSVCVCVCVRWGLLSTGSATNTDQLSQFRPRYLADGARAKGMCRCVKWMNKLPFRSSLIK